MFARMLGCVFQLSYFICSVLARKATFSYWCGLVHAVECLMLWNDSKTHVLSCFAVPDADVVFFALWAF